MTAPNRDAVPATGAETDQTVPVFAPGDLVQLGAIVQTAKELTIQAERNAEVLRRITTELTQALQRADALRQPVHRPAPSTRDNGRPTVNARGPQRILEILAQHAGRLSIAAIQIDSGYAPSTMRTYLPALREAGFITYDENMVMLTGKRAPMEFTAR